MHDAELFVCEPVADGAGHPPGVLPPAPGQVLPTQPHARLSTNSQVTGTGKNLLIFRIKTWGMYTCIQDGWIVFIGPQMPFASQMWS